MEDPHRKRRLLAVGLVALLAFSIVASVGVVAAYPATNRDRIRPGVSVHGLEVGNLTVEGATAALIDRLPNPTGQMLRLKAGEHTRQLSWSEAGQSFDYAATAVTAHQVARDGSWFEQVSSAWRVRSQGHRVEPVVVPADSKLVQAVLAETAATIAVAPADAQLQIEPGGGVVARPGQAGRKLDVATSTQQVLQALADQMEKALIATGEKNSTVDVDLTVTEMPPALAEPEPAYTLAKSLLAQPFVLVADDLVLTNYYAEFAAPPEQVAAWLRAIREDGPDEARIVLEVSEEAVRSWLIEVAPQLGSERLLDLDETGARAMVALTNGVHQAQARIRHPETTYLVQPGDGLYDIAYVHGFPFWWLEEANPDVDPDVLLIGMELTIPSIDVLFPEPLVPGKRIEIDLWEQRVRAYEDEALIFDLTSSSGMTSTPTLAGQFQVLFKEDVAYAPRWSLDMPYFLGIYQEGPDFYNGVHELPIRADGSRLWAGSLGWPASYGCIILDIEDAKDLYDWAPVGTYVLITGMAPDTPILHDGEESAAQQ